MEDLTREQKIEAAHQTAMQSADTVMSNWLDRPNAKKSKRKFGRTPTFRIAKSFKAGYGRFS